MNLYKLEWETVKVRHLWRYMDKHPDYHFDAKQVIANRLISDSHWIPVVRQGTLEELQEQYNQLRTLESSDTGFVRNVKLYKMVAEPKWEEVRV